MTQAIRDQNFVPVALAQSNTDATVTLPFLVDSATGRLLTDVAGAGSGTVTSVSVVSANGFAGTVATATTTPAITLSTTVNAPVLAGNGTAIAAATTTGSGSTVVLNNSPVFADDITVGVAASATGSVIFKGITSGTVTLKVADAAGTWTLTLPTDDGDSGQVLSTNGSGVTSWVSAGGVPTTITVASETTDASCFVGFFTAATGDLGPKTNPGFLFNSTNNYLGLGGAPSEILHLIKGTGEFTTIRYDSGTTQGYFFAFDGDNTVNIGSNSNSTVNFKVNNTSEVSLTATAMSPATSDGNALGTTALMWSDLFLASGGVINWNNGDSTITHSAGLLTTNVPVTVTGVVTASGFAPTSSTATGNRMYLPAADTLGWAINGTGEMQLTSTALSPIADGGSSLGTTALGWQNLFANTGFVLNIENGNWVATHTSAILTVGTGDLRVTTAGTDATSVVTVGGTQTLTNKTLTTPTINAAVISGDFQVDGTPNTDDTWNGKSTNTFNAGATIAQFDCVYLSSSSTWLLTDADAVGTAGSVPVQMAAESGTNTNPLRVILPGTFVRNDAWNWTPGAPLFLDTATPGGLTATAPSGTDDVVRIVAHAYTADVIFWNPSNDWITRT